MLSFAQFIIINIAYIIYQCNYKDGEHFGQLAVQKLELCKQHHSDVDMELGTAKNILGFAVFKIGEVTKGLEIVEDANKILKTLEDRQFDNRRTAMKRSAVVAHLGIMNNLKG